MFQTTNQLCIYLDKYSIHGDDIISIYLVQSQPSSGAKHPTNRRPDMGITTWADGRYIVMRAYIILKVIDI